MKLQSHTICITNICWFFVSDPLCLLVSHIVTAAGLRSAVSQLDDCYRLLVKFCYGSYVNHVDSGNIGVRLIIYYPHWW